MKWNGKKIKQYRLLRVMSQNQLAKDLGITQPTIAKLEMGVLRIEKYQKQLDLSLKRWKEDKIKELRQEIEFIETFL